MFLNLCRQKNVFSCAANFSRGKKCIFCGSFKTKRTARGYVRCRKKTCGKQKSLKQLKRELDVLKGFYQGFSVLHRQIQELQFLETLG